MKILRNKTKVTTIAFVLMLTMTAALITCVPTVNATNITTYAFLNVYPDPVGVGQPLTVVMWLNLYPPFVIGPKGERLSSAYGKMWENYSVTVTKPDGTTETKRPFKSDMMGTGYTSYVPETVGQYTFQFSFPGQTMPLNQTVSAPPAMDYYKPSTSKKVTVTVQQDPIPYWPAAALPTDYWDRPIYGENREWSSISGNWLMPGYNTTERIMDGGSAFAPYTTAPNTPHIVWTKPIEFGGLIGGEYCGANYYDGESYETLFSPPLIINGVLYYNQWPSGSQPSWFNAVDLRTGETLWTQNITTIASYNYLPPGTPPPGTDPRYGASRARITLGQIYKYVSPNQAGGTAYLWSIYGTSPKATYDMYDATTGQFWLRIVNATTGQHAFSPCKPDGSGGDLLCYVLGPSPLPPLPPGVFQTQRWLALWNSSKCILRNTPTALGLLGTVPNVNMTSTGAWYWRPPYGATALDWKLGIEWNVTIPTLPYNMAEAMTVGSPGASNTLSGGVLLAQINIPAYIHTLGTGYPIFTHVAYNAKTGAQMWAVNRTDIGQQSRSGHVLPLKDGVYCMFVPETLQWYAYNIYTGNQVWGPTKAYTNDFGDWDTGDMAAYGRLYASGIDGFLHCYDLKTGDHLWDWSTGSSGFETPYGNFPLYGGILVADGKVYACTGTHGNGMDLWRGGTMSCIDAYTGKSIWRIDGWFQGASTAVVDGYLVALNGYDNKIYCFGKGKTATTVSATPGIITNSSSVLIQGTVTDQSPGAEGTPAITDKGMQAWMEYLYEQKPQPTNSTGVPVELKAMRSDGSIIDIATVTSDIMGHFEYTWTPPTTDTYKILAIFLGSESYFTSSAETALGVTAAPPAAAPAAEAAVPDYTPMFAGIIVAVVVSILIGIYSIYDHRKLRK